MTPQAAPAEALARSARAGAPLGLALIGLAFALAIAGIWLMALQRIAVERNQAIEAAMKSNASLAIAFEQQVSRTLKAAEQVAAFVREQYLVRGREIDLRQWVEDGVIRDSMFTIVSVVDETGRIVSSNEAVGNVNYADRDFFMAQIFSTDDSLYVNRPVFGRVSQRWQVPMSLRITRADGSFGGVIVLSVDPASFTGLHRQADLGPQGLLELAGLDGVVRARGIGDRTEFDLDASALGWFQRQANNAESAYIDPGTEVDGVARIVAYRTMSDYPLMISVGTPRADELGPVQQRRSTYLLVVVVASLVLMTLAGMLMLLLARQRAAALALQASEALYRATFHQAAMGIAHIAPDGRILGANEKFCQMLGFDLDELRARSVLELSDPEERDAVRQFLEHRLSAWSPVFSQEIEKLYRRKDGATLWVCEAIGVVTDVRGRPDFLVAVTQDITARKDLEARLAHDALHDPLTGLPNRVMFVDRLARVLESARRHQTLAGVLYIDLDGFKEVNDTRGHAAGDALLQQVSRRLEQCVRAEDTVSRFGGDEFGVVLANLTLPQDCEIVAGKIIEALSAPFDLDGGPVTISASVGAALHFERDEDSAALLARADAAMYEAKKAGKNRFLLKAGA
jgi:diguanylate cyclase (GGDEF)-like protein/PAS domain S-box-containing protein